MRTPFGGTHPYFKHPHGPCPPSSPGPNSPLGWHISLNTAGSYIPAAGSPTRWGACTVIHDAEGTELPAWITDSWSSDSTTALRGAA